MIGNLLAERMAAYAPANALEQEHVLAELMQQIVLAALAQAGFFAEAIFHGGTCLRLFFGMHRFSEDLDFMLVTPNATFAWAPYLGAVRDHLLAEGIGFDVIERSQVDQADQAIRKAFLKTDSLGQVLEFALPFRRDSRRKIRIKLEVDTRPPPGSAVETAFLSFPITAGVTVQSLASAFGLKSHALLCRPYVKGRDWYDFLWFVDRGIVPDLALLEGAIDQQGPWAGQGETVDADWYLRVFRGRIEELDWVVARADVGRFLRAQEQSNLAQWGPELFLYQLQRLSRLFGDVKI
ncbi:MAG: nucleotidyl transferase AbiEii/AbiGii toxin family protein [Deltaproteobacteria bacterium]|nr:nucleotidyl transferase AbiEii/AbiGii toxin family protein [Deltaproteobacteria bacterium]